jgi:sodium transport system permease protein
MVEALRDRRTLFLMLGLPVFLYPILFLTLGALTESYFAELAERTVRIALWGEAPEGIEQALAGSDDVTFDIVDVGSLEILEDPCAAARRYLIDEDVEVILLLGKETRCSTEEDGDESDEKRDAPLGRFEILYDGANEFSERSKNVIQGLLTEYSRDVLSGRLDEAGMDPGLATPFGIESTNLAGQKRMGGHFAGRILPMILIMMVCLGAFYPSIDLSAGEKERSTLETLISAPVHASEIVAGKYLAVVTIALFASGANLVSMGLTINRMAWQLADAGQAMVLTAGGAFIVFVMLIPSALFFSAVMFANASLARSFKEAQNMLTPTFFVIFFPAMLATLPGIELNPVTIFAPVLNIALVIKESLIGELKVDTAFAVMLANGVYAVMALVLAARLFRAERVLFAVDKPWTGWRDAVDPRQWWASLKRPVEPGRVFTPGGAMLFFAVTLVLLYYVASALQARDVISGLLVTEWFLLLIPSLLVVLLWRLDPKETFSLRLPSMTGFVGTLLVAVSAWTLGLLGAALTELVLPMPQAFVESMREFFNVVTEGLDTPGVLFLTAFSPAVCEEAAFRGVILSGLAGRLSKWQAVIVVGLLFGFFHLSIYRLVPTALLGMVITFAVLETRSILPGVLIHFGVNAILFSAEMYPSLASWMGLDTTGGRIDSWTPIAGFGVLLIVGLVLLAREKR